MPGSLWAFFECGIIIGCVNPVKPKPADIASTTAAAYATRHMSLDFTLPQAQAKAQCASFHDIDPSSDLVSLSYNFIYLTCLSPMKDSVRSSTVPELYTLTLPLYRNDLILVSWIRRCLVLTPILPACAIDTSLRLYVFNLSIPMRRGCISSSPFR